MREVRTNCTESNTNPTSLINVNERIEDRRERERVREREREREIVNSHVHTHVHVCDVDDVAAPLKALEESCTYCTYAFYLLLYVLYVFCSPT